jgi:hypothetical protein
MKRRFRVQWGHDDEAVFQLMKLNEFLSDILGVVEEINREVHELRNSVDALKEG